MENSVAQRQELKDVISELEARLEDCDIAIDHLEQEKCKNKKHIEDLRER